MFNTMNNSLLGTNNINGTPTYKKRTVLTLGSPNVGKSSIATRFKDDIFLEAYEPTLQNNIKKIFQFNGAQIEIEIIDIDGQTEYTIFTANKFSYGINGYLLIYSIDNKNSFDQLKIINSKLDDLVGRKVPKILIGNKVDNDSKQLREVEYNEGVEFAKKLDCPFLETSAKNNVRIDMIFSKILSEINQNENAFDEKTLPCLFCFQFIIKKEKIMKITYKVLAVMEIMISLAGFGIVMMMFFRTNNWLFTDLIAMFYSLWGTAFGVIALYAMQRMESKWFQIHLYGLIAGFLMIIACIIIPIILYRETIEIFDLNNCYYFIYLPLKILFGFPLFFLSLAFKEIYEKDLLFYIV